MPNPTKSDVHVDAMLTNISVAFMQEATEFVASRVFPTVPVAKQSDRYFVYDRADFFRDTMQVRAPGTESAGGGYRLDNTPTYYADVWALHKDIDDQTRANEDNPLNGDRDATLYLSQQALIRMENAWAASYFTTSVWTGDQTGVAAAPAANQFVKWSVGGSTPIKDIRAQALAVKARTGYMPNKLVVGADVWNTLQDHADFLGRVTGGANNAAPALVNPTLMAGILELDEVLIARGIETTSLEGASTATYDFIAKDAALLVYSAPNPGLQTPTGGYTFAWTGYTGAGPQGQRISNIRADLIKSDRIEIEMAFDQKLVSADLGVFFTDAI
jgi:hypothetical protein